LAERSSGFGVKGHRIERIRAAIPEIPGRQFVHSGLLRLQEPQGFAGFRYCERLCAFRNLPAAEACQPTEPWPNRVEPESELEGRTGFPKLGAHHAEARRDGEIPRRS